MGVGLSSNRAVWLVTAVIFAFAGIPLLFVLVGTQGAGSSTWLSLLLGPPVVFAITFVGASALAALSANVQRSALVHIAKSAAIGGFVGGTLVPLLIFMAWRLAGHPARATILAGFVLALAMPWFVTARLVGR